MINEQNMGKFFRDSNGQVYRLIIYCSLPTATMENIVTQHKVSGAVGSPALSEFVLLGEEAQEITENLAQMLVHRPKSLPEGMLEVRDPLTGRHIGYIQESNEVIEEKPKEPVKYCDDCDCGKKEGCG